MWKQRWNGGISPTPFSGSGTISAANTYTVKSLVKGTVLTADFEVGDTIEKGTVLYTIDSSDVATSVEKAQLALEQAQRSYNDAADAQYIRSVIGGHSGFHQGQGR